MNVASLTSGRLALSLVGALLLGPAWAQEPDAAETGVAESETAGGSEESAGPALNYRTGDVLLPNKVATLHLGTRYRYLDPAETEKLLVAWGNQPGSRTEGTIVPADVEPLSDEGWAVIVTYDDDGHVDDSDARDIDYDDMLKDMKEGTESANADRKRAGYEAVHLVGWAETPHYDGASKKLYWAKELDFEGSGSHTLNYDVRVLGREGVLSMNAVAGIGQLDRIRRGMRPLIEVAEFNEGYRYAEFNPKTDKLAEYGLGALIAGGVAAKLGLFGKLFAFIVAFKKAFIAGAIALFGGLARLFKKKDSAA
jgi:uncharacterized membrane-anchored protein